ncbi:MAG: hypothetical protein ACQERK_06375 [Campylobacterota bacterium]
MLSNKAITQRFEVQLGTLYNWKKSKPRLYKYLQNADYNSDRNTEINILLQHYLKTVDKDFSQKQLEFLIDSSLELTCIEEVEQFELEFMKTSYKKIAKDAPFVMDLYNRLSELNIIEKYILYKKIYRYRTMKKKPELSSYFANYLAAAKK